jgi:hypothetical protein
MYTMLIKGMHNGKLGLRVLSVKIPSGVSGVSQIFSTSYCGSNRYSIEPTLCAVGVKALSVL